MWSQAWRGECKRRYAVSHRVLVLAGATNRHAGIRYQMGIPFKRQNTAISRAREDATNGHAMQAPAHGDRRVAALVRRCLYSKCGPIYSIYVRDYYHNANNICALNKSKYVFVIVLVKLSFLSPVLWSCENTTKSAFNRANNIAVYDGVFFHKRGSASAAAEVSSRKSGEQCARFLVIQGQVKP